jgi:hypothetical protein
MAISGVKLALVRFQLLVLINRLGTFFQQRELFKKVWDGNVEPLQNLKKETGMYHRPFIVGHALNCNLRLTCPLKFLEANVPRLVFYGLDKNRIAVLEKADRYT